MEKKATHPTSAFRKAQWLHSHSGRCPTTLFLKTKVLPIHFSTGVFQEAVRRKVLLVPSQSEGHSPAPPLPSVVRERPEAQQHSWDTAGAPLSPGDGPKAPPHPAPEKSEGTGL